jgi:hypothetical protein
MNSEDRGLLQGNWEDGTWEGARRWQMTAAMRATPEQRLDWLEEMIEIAHSSGAARRRLEALHSLGSEGSGVRS